jgi:hypothetical protein
MQEPAPQPRSGTDPEHHARHPTGHTADMPVRNLISRKILVLEGLGERQRLPEAQ